MRMRRLWQGSKFREKIRLAKEAKSPSKEKYIKQKRSIKL